MAAISAPLGRISQEPPTAPQKPAAAMFEGEPDLIPTSRLSAILGIHLNTARALCRSGELPAVRIGSRWYVPRTRLEAFVMEGGIDG